MSDSLKSKIITVIFWRYPQFTQYNRWFYAAFSLALRVAEAELSNHKPKFLSNNFYDRSCLENCYNSDCA